MSQPRFEFKVGLFVLICLALLAGLLLQFSKGVTLFRPTYTVILKAENVNGLRARASVLMSGVQVGTVSRIALSREGTNVSIYLRIYSQFVIRKDARFAIEAAGFLGDQYVAAYPMENKGEPLTNNSEAVAEAPFNLQEVARSASGFIKRMDETARRLNDIISDVRRLALNDKTLTNLAQTVDNMQQVSENALVTVTNIDLLVKTNSAPVSLAVSNLVGFSDRLNVLADSAQSIVNTNGPEISQAISNVQNSTAILTNLLTELQAGKGLAGSLLKNGELANNVSVLTSNLAVSAGNLNRLGLWRFLWRHADPTNAQSAPNWPRQ